MHPFKKIVISFLIISVICSCFIATKSVYAIDTGYKITDYNVSVTVLENNAYNVTEKIKVFYNQRRHGIIRNIPVIVNAKRVIDSKKVDKKHKIIVDNINVRGGEFDVSSEGADKVIKIGSEDTTVLGEKEYIISYSYDIGNDGISSFDDFYFNIIGDRWDTTISNVSFDINFPKDFDEKKVDFFSKDNEVKWERKGNTISGSIDFLSYLDPLTMRVELEEGYFVGGRQDSSYYYSYLFIAIAILMIICILLWYYYGKDNEIVQTVEFNPPKNMTSAEIGYAIDGIVDTKDVVSLIVLWANNGYLRIEELEADDMLLIKLKEPVNLKGYEKIMFNELFKNRESVKSSDLKYNFTEVLAKTSSGIKGSYQMEFGKLFTSSSIFMMVLSGALVGLGAGLFLFTVVLESVFNTMDGLLAMGITTLICLGAVSMIAVFIDKARKRIQKILIMTPLLFISIIIVLIGISSEVLLLQGIVTAAFVLVCGVFAAFTKKRTKESVDILGKLYGFEDFLRLAEKEKLEMLVEENPKYFYNILPYAYVLGVSDIWTKKFEQIALAQPEWYTHTSNRPLTTYILMSSLSRRLNNCSANVATPKPSSSGKGGSIGGGSSGGGFGGGGGSSW